MEYIAFACHKRYPYAVVGDGGGHLLREDRIPPRAWGLGGGGDGGWLVLDRGWDRTGRFSSPAWSTPARPGSCRGWWTRRTSSTLTCWSCSSGQGPYL